MLRISKLSDYAIIVLGHMAKQPGRSFAAHELAEASGIGSPTASKVLKTMAKAGLLISIRGARGGYQLALKPEQTSIASIIGALEGPIALTECTLAQSQCDQSRTCHVQGNWSLINRAIQTALEAITLADMTQPMQRTPRDFHVPLHQIAVHSHRPEE